ncbi:MAG TPA: ferritin-like domain-containing protein [Polyangia bacterium]|nr:ferritin-like domain-containing protein [Polyangia bacterium]
MPKELFELSLLGGAIERRYRKLRPDVDAIAWDKLAKAKFTPAQREAGRRFWTANALSEHAAAAGCSAVLRALVEARAPLDLVATESGFVLDEIAHTEMSARVANALGGGAAFAYDGRSLVPEPPTDLSPLGRAVFLALRIHCVDETFGLPLAREMIRHQPHPVMRDVLRRIVKDEAAHARLGWIILDWADELLDEPTRVRLRALANDAIAEQHKIAATVPPDDGGHTVGWLPSAIYTRLAPKVLAGEVCAPLRERGFLD